MYYFRVGNNVEITSNVSIIGDRNKEETLRIGDNSVIAAGAVVLKSVSNNTVVGGIPAKVLKVINDDENWITKRTFEKEFELRHYRNIIEPHIDLRMRNAWDIIFRYRNVDEEEYYKSIPSQAGKWFPISDSEDE